MEKFTTEVIEQYLEGTLDTNERLEMEEAMLLNPELKEEVLLQKALVQKIEEQALRVLAQDAHLRYTKGGGSGFYSGGNWIFGMVFLFSMLAGLLYYIYTSNKSEDLDIKIENQITDAATGSNKLSCYVPVIVGVQEKTQGDFPDVSFMVYTFFAEKGAEIKDPRSGTVIKIAPNSLIDKNGAAVKGQVTLKYREFRTQADIALSGIPMIYNGHNFNSAGMFEIYALQHTDTLGINKLSAVSIDFVMTKNEAGFGFYQLDNQTKQWEFIRALGQDEGDAAGWIGGMGVEKGEKEFTYLNDSEISTLGVPLQDAFTRSLGYQKAVLDGETIIPEVPENMDALFANKDYKQITGSDTNTSNRIVVAEIHKQSKTKEKSSIADFFKKISSTGGGIAIPLSDKPKVDTSLSIVVKDRRYTVYENGKNVVMTELSSLNGSQFMYEGNEDFDRLTKMTFYDVRLTRDTTVLNRFVLSLKTDGKILTYQLKLSKPDFTAFEEYDKQQRLRMLTFNNRVKLNEKEYAELLKLRKERGDLMDSLSLYGNENIFRMARLIMTEEELKMSKEQWFASLDTNTTLRNRIDAALDSIEAYGDNADAYIRKVAKERNQKIAQPLNKTVDNRIYNPEYSNAGHYFNPLVVGLRIKGFGIFNCDQVYMIQNSIAVKGEYVTEGNIEIKNFIAISLIDPKVNAAFSFDPRFFICSSTGDNMILLFTKDKKIYFFDKEKWKMKQIKEEGTYTFEMTDITARVKTPEDLQRILEANPL